MQINAAASAPPHVFIRRNRSRGARLRRAPYNVASCKLVPPRATSGEEIVNVSIWLAAVSIVVWLSYFCIIPEDVEISVARTHAYANYTSMKQRVFKRRSLKKPCFILSLFHFYRHQVVSCLPRPRLPPSTSPSTHSLFSYHHFVRWTGDNASFVAIGTRCVYEKLIRFDQWRLIAILIAAWNLDTVIKDGIPRTKSSRQRAKEQTVCSDNRQFRAAWSWMGSVNCFCSSL